MVVKFELTPAQAEKLFWDLKKRRRTIKAGPLGRAYDVVSTELEARLADQEK